MDSLKDFRWRKKIYCWSFHFYSRNVASFPLSSLPCLFQKAVIKRRKGFGKKNHVIPCCGFRLGNVSQAKIIPEQEFCQGKKSSEKYFLGLKQKKKTFFPRAFKNRYRDRKFQAFKSKNAYFWFFSIFIEFFPVVRANVGNVFTWPVDSFV